MSCQVRMVTTDGDVRTVQALQGQSVVEAAKDADIILPSLCGKGTCGTCIAQVSAGDYTMRPFEADALGANAPEASALLCCVEPTSDLDVNLPFESAKLIDQAPLERTATIASIEHLRQHIVKLTLQLDEHEVNGSAAEFEAGQYMQLVEPDSGVLRAYSMSTCRTGTGRWNS